MKKRILVLTGSPRKDGNTETLAAAFVKGAEEAGHPVDIFHLRGKQIGGCLDCKYCFSHDGACVQKDDMQNLYPLLYKADMIVLASPVYYYALSAQIKLAIDRMYVSVTKKLPIKSAALLLCLADGKEGADPSIANYHAITSYLGWKDAGIIVAHGVSGKGEIKGHPALKQAEQLGRNLK